MSNAPTLETERLILRPFVPEDAEELHRILNLDGILRYFPGPGNPDMERVERFISRQTEQWREKGYAWWAVETKADRRLLGWNGLQYLPETDETEIGFLIDKAFWGRGLTPEAGRASLRFGFETLGLGEVIALAHPENTASQRVMEKLGLPFVEETVYFDMEVRRFVLSAADYRAAREADSEPGPAASTTA